MQEDTKHKSSERSTRSAAEGGAEVEDKLLRVGDLAKAVGKTVRAMHLYEELGLLEPQERSEGGFRLYGKDAIDRIQWIIKLQAIGFTLAEIQGFVADFRNAHSAPEAASRVRALFAEKQARLREQIAQLHTIELDVADALTYLESCHTCSTEYAPTECGGCDHHGHHKGEAPPLFAGITKRPDADRAAKAQAFDVPVGVLYREGNT